MRGLSYLLPYFGRYRSKLILGLGAIVLAVVVGLASPLIIGRAVDSFVADASGRTLLLYAAALVAVTGFQGLFSFAQRMLLVTLSRDIERDLRNDYYRHLQTLSASFYHRSHTGDLMARATNDLQAVRMLCGPAIMYSVSTFLTAMGALSFMAAIHWRLTLLALSPMPLVAIATKVFGQRIHVLFERVQEQFSALSARVQENLAGLRVVRAYAREGSEQRRFAELNREYVARNRRLIRWSAGFHPILQLLVGVGFVAVLWYGGLQVVAGDITVGQFVTFNFFLSMLVWPMIAIGWVINLIQRGSASLRRIKKILATEPDIRDEPPFVSTAPVVGTVELRALTLEIEGVDGSVLDELSLSAAAGERVAIVGRTGAGKTTLLSLLPRLLDPPPGTVFIDGHDVRRLPLALLRSQISMVPQETFLFSATVGENISLGAPDASSEDLLEAAALAGLDLDLAGFPAGLDTMVGERGLTLSGGQKQRVALARALVRRPRLLLLDDCLSAVDAETEERILANLERVFPGRTVFQVSHRMSAIQHADQILVLDRGRITERGSHATLIAGGGLYAALWRRQQLERELAAV